MRYRLQRHDGTDCSATMVPITVLRMVPIQRYRHITQSIAGAIIYFPFGLYLAPYCGYTLSLLVGFVLFLLQVQFCKWWLKGHKQGPLESLWHKWTWMYSKK